MRCSPISDLLGRRSFTRRRLISDILWRMSLERFHEAQAKRSGGYDTALAEIRAGGKRSHWIWYIFPQIEGLGRSSTARAYAIRDLGEACAYLRDPILRARYEEIVAAVSGQLARGIRVEDLMGSQTDALKLVSSLTLFHAAAEQLEREDPVFASLAKRLAVLLGQTGEQGYPACDFTLSRIDSVRRDMQ
jgi:uncharacterized protein (DUF1810 family)